ncbi:MAG: metalloregulator ArsR/SmtB family transcription factor [Nanoarchaeota archaeon]
MISKNILHSCHAEGFKEGELYDAYKIFFGTLVSESRLKIINLLQKGKKNVGELAHALSMDQTAVSHDLARLKQCGFVHATREGKFVYYSLNNDIHALMNLIEKHMGKHCIHILHSMKGVKEGP